MREQSISKRKVDVFPVASNHALLIQVDVQVLDNHTVLVIRVSLFELLAKCLELIHLLFFEQIIYDGV